MDNENTKKRSYTWIGWTVAIAIIVIAIGFYVWDVVLEHAPGTLRDGILYLNTEEIFVYDSLDSAFTNTKGEGGTPRELKEILPEILAENKLVYLDGTTVGILVDDEITKDFISSASEDRVIYVIGKNFLADKDYSPFLSE